MQDASTPHGNCLLALISVVKPLDRAGTMPPNQSREHAKDPGPRDGPGPLWANRSVLHLSLSQPLTWFQTSPDPLRTCLRHRYAREGLGYGPERSLPDHPPHANRTRSERPLVSLETENRSNKETKTIPKRLPGLWSMDGSRHRSMPGCAREGALIDTLPTNKRLHPSKPALGRHGWGMASMML
jgi:hypothetical protein